MARKTVQGYTDKSYYENEKFAGVVMTDDPLQEGFFRHLVNFKIADTGLSIRPRIGYLTTTIRKPNTEQSLITLNEDTIIFLQHDIQKHVVYDFTANRAYIADLSRYNVAEDLMVPIEDTSVSIDWDNIIDYLLENFSTVNTYYNAVYADVFDQLGDAETATRDARSIIQKYFIQHTTTVEGSQLNHITDLYGVKKHLLKIIIEDNDPDDESNASEYTTYDPTVAYTAGDKVYYLASTYQFLQDMDIPDFDANAVWIDAGTYVVYQGDIYIITGGYDPSSSGWLSEQAGLIDPVSQGWLEEIVDVMVGASIEKTTLLLAFYYRKDAVTTTIPNLPGQTLVFELLDYNQHPTYDPTNRNIASKNSIIPNPMQVVHTEGTRPDGHTNLIGLLYAQEQVNERYLILSTYRERKITFIPHFSLNPADYDMGVESGAKWAYRYDIIRMKQQYSVEDFENADVIMQGNWYELDNPGTPIFTDFLDTDNTAATVLAERHNKGCPFVIHVVGKTTMHSGTTEVDDSDAGVYTKPTAPDAATMDELAAREVVWKNLIDTIESRESLIKAIQKIGKNADFILQDYRKELLGEEAYHELYLAGNEMIAYKPGLIYDEISTVDIVSGDRTNISEAILTSEELVDLIQDNYFDIHNIEFRTRPIRSNDTLKIYTDDVLQGTVSRVAYYELDFWGGGYLDSDPKFAYDKNYNLVVRADLAEVVNGNVVLKSDTIKTGHADYPDMEAEGFFSQGYGIVFYLKPYLTADVSGLTILEEMEMKNLWIATGYSQTRVLSYRYDSLGVTYIPEYQVLDPEKIQSATTQILYQDLYLVTWIDNLVYISEPGQHYYYKEVNKKEFSERVVKVLEFKNILLVFTIQHLYAVYQETLEIPGVDEEGNAITIKEVYWASQRVLYNVRTNDKYKDVIQVFNEYVLFYSSEGQLYMIKPNTMIDSETRFSLKYFNQAANDVLLNYDEYINERLANYNLSKRIDKDDVQIKALLSVNFIKIFYNVPDLITYILIYDVINNRYTIEDTVSFTLLNDKMFVESGEMYLSKHNNKLYFTFPYKDQLTMDNHVDMSIVNNFKRIGISTMLDTGNLSLNNHLVKTFRDLHVVFKNLSTSQLLFNAETLIDDIVSHPFYNTQLEVHDVGGTSYFVSVPKTDNNDLIDLVGDNQVSAAGSEAFIYAIEHGALEETILLNFSDYTSSKLLTYRTSILGRGKVLRIKMQFISKGDYKIQRFGIIYKERRV